MMLSRQQSATCNRHHLAVAPLAATRPQQVYRWRAAWSPLPVDVDLVEFQRDTQRASHAWWSLHRCVLKMNSLHLQFSLYPLVEASDALGNVTR